VQQGTLYAPSAHGIALHQPNKIINVHIQLPDQFVDVPMVPLPCVLVPQLLVYALVGCHIASSFRFRLLVQMMVLLIGAFGDAVIC
jgi:hypothetical protein